MRNETRAERRNQKSKTAIKYPVDVCTTYFICNDNVAFCARALACFGGDNLHIIGKQIPDAEFRRLSAGNCNLINVIYHKTPAHFIQWARDNNAYIICSDLIDGAQEINEAFIPLNSKVIFVVGSETDGIPTEITHVSDATVFIPMPGPGFCLNTSQAANILLYEYARRQSV